MAGKQLVAARNTPMIPFIYLFNYTSMYQFNWELMTCQGPPHFTFKHMDTFNKKPHAVTVYGHARVNV